jgi:hypothetical protein
MLLLALLGCRPLFTLPADPDGDPDESGLADSADGPSDSGAEVPTWWGLGGVLAIEGGLPDPAASRLVLETRGETCSVDATLDSATPEEARGALGAWQLELVPVADAPCAWVGPTRIHVGLGPSSPEQAPAARRAGWDPGASLGLELGDAPAARRLVGLAATEPMRAGAEPPPTAGPLEGAWTLVMLNGLPLDTP